MPNYDYKCPVCGATEEVRQGILEDDRYIPCKQCGIPKQRVPVNTFIFQFKGGV